MSEDEILTHPFMEVPKQEKDVTTFYAEMDEAELVPPVLPADEPSLDDRVRERHYRHEDEAWRKSGILQIPTPERLDRFGRR